MVRRLIADNRKARFNYAIEESVEAGLVLTGTEVKALREGRANIAEAYAAPADGELWLINAHIPEYKSGNRYNHEPRRPRKLLLHKKQLETFLGLAKQGGMTLVPLKLYFNDRGVAKLELAVARGKKLHDKRQTIKDRDWQRQKQRLMRAKG